MKFNLLARQTVLFLAFLFILTISIADKTYFLGGDDTRLYYLYPSDYFRNFSTHLIQNTSVSGLDVYFPQNYIAPFNLILILMNKILPFVNLQTFFFWTNVFLGIIFFYKLIDTLVDLKHKFEKFAALLSGVLYVFSIFNVYSLFNHQLFAQYLLSLYPMSIYLFAKSLKERKIIYVLIAALTLSVFSIVLLSLPWLIALILVTIPVFATFYSWNKKLFISYLTIFLSLLFVLNFHWLIHLAGSTINSTVASPDAFLGTDYRLSAESGIRTTSKLNTVFYPMLNLFHRFIQADFRWMQNAVFESWYLKILPFNIIFPLIIFAAGMLVNKKDKRYKAFVSLTAAWLASIYFYTVNIGLWGIDLFVYLSAHIPGFVMFRNMYDKFAPAMAFSYSLILAVSIAIIFSKLKKEKLIYLFLVVYFLAVIVQIYPFLSGKFELPIWKTTNSFQRVNNLNSDYIDLANYVKDIDDESLFLSLPLTLGNNALIQDAQIPNYYYTGVSPLLIMSGKNDYSGLLSFGEFADDLDNALRNQDYQASRLLLRQLNVGYLIVNNSISNDLLQSYHFEGGFYGIQEGLLENIAGDKVADFGERYSIYKVLPEYEPRYIYVGNNKMDFLKSTDTAIDFQKQSEGLIKISAKNIKKGDYLVFLEPYNQQWMLLDEDKKIIEGEHVTAFGYANAWKIPSDSGESTFYIKFSPYSYYYPAIVVSTVAFVLTFFYAIYLWRFNK